MPEPNAGVEPVENPQLTEDADIPDTDDKSEPEPEPEDKPEPEPDKEPEDDGFKQFLKENELPDSFESPEDFAKAYKEVLSQFKRDQTDRGQERRVDPTPKELPSPQQSYFNTKAADATIKAMEESGMFGENKELAASYKSIAKVIDNAYGAELGKAEQVMTTMFSELTRLRDRVLGMEWRGINPDVQKRVKREDIDRLMNDHKLSDYESAVKFYAMTKDPTIFKLLTQKAQESQVQPNKNNKRFRWGARGGGQSNYDSQGYKQYLNPDGSVNEAKLNRLPQKAGDKILDEIIKSQSRNR